MPLLLDGQMQEKGRSVLSALRKYPDYQSRPVKKSHTVQGNSINDLFFKSLVDTDPAGRIGMEKLHEKVLEQKRILAESGISADSASNSLTGERKAFFDANLLAQQRVMFGLTSWLDECILAEESSRGNNHQGVQEHLEKALANTDIIFEGLQHAAQGKWADWYRGEKKLDMNRLKRETEITLKQYQSPKK